MLIPLFCAGENLWLLIINVAGEGRQTGDKGTDNVLFKLHEYSFFMVFSSFTVMKVKIDIHCCK